MFDYFVKEKTKTSWINNAVLDGVLILGDDGEYYSPYAIDTIGTIPEVTGYHVNIRSHKPLEFNKLTLIAAPSTPYRTWL